MSFDLSLKDVFLIVGDILNLALGSLSSAKLLEFKQKIPTAKAAVGMIKSDCTSWRCLVNLCRFVVALSFCKSPTFYPVYPHLLIHPKEA